MKGTTKGPKLDFSKWQKGPPDRFGLWIVMCVDVSDGELVGFVRVKNGPRGGVRRPHWVDPELGARVRSSHWDARWRCRRLHINWLSNAESACHDAAALQCELETTKEMLRREVAVRVKAQVECQDAQESEASLLAQVRAHATPAPAEVERIPEVEHGWTAQFCRVVESDPYRWKEEIVSLVRCYRDARAIIGRG